MKNKLSKTLEIIWLITSILCFITAIHQTLVEGISKSYVFFIFSLLALLMYFLRRHLSKTNKTENTNG